MTVELWSTADTVPFLREGSPLISYVTLKQISQHAGDLEKFTVLAQVGATLKWQNIEPGNADGSQFPRAILMRTISEAQIQAGDVEKVPIMRGGSPAVVVDMNRLIVEGPGTLDTLVNLPAGIASTIKELLVWANIYVIDTQDIEKFQEPPPPGP